MTDGNLVRRLEKLERENRRLKRLALLPFVLVAALGAIYVASCSSAGTRSNTHGVSDKITAREFDVLDANGKVRVKIAMDCSVPKDCVPAIDLYDENGSEVTSVGAGVLVISGPKGETVVLDNNIQIKGFQKGLWTGELANLGAGSMGPGGALTLSGKDGTTVMLESQSPMPGGAAATLDLSGKDGNSVFLDSDSPVIEIADGKGSYMDLGSTSLVVQRTGTTEETSAASIVMFGNDKKHHVIWQAP